MTTCPCGRLQGKKTLSYVQCCGRYLESFDSTPAPDPESLMRSRYSAFVLERAQYLLDTWDEKHRPAQLDFDPDVKWLGLAVKAHRMLGPDHAEVEFIARSRLHGIATRLHELSCFELRDQRWYYVDGVMLK